MVKYKSMRERAALLGLLLLLAVAAIPWGGNRPAAIHFYGFWLTILTLLSLLAPSSQRHTLPKWPVVCALLYFGWLLLQIAPLPVSWLQTLAPQAATSHAAAPGSTWSVISLSPGATISGIFLSLVYGQAYWLASRHITS